MEKFSKRALLLSTFLALSNCGGLYSDYDTTKDNIDRPGQLDRKDFVDHMLPQTAPKELKVETKKPPIPSASDLITTPPKPRLGVNKTVSLSVTEDVPLKDVFIELARLADIDIEIDSAITGGVIFKAKNRPFDEVVERISDLAGLNYTVNNGVLRIMRDSPYIENYPVDFLNIVRSNTGAVSVNTSVLSSGVGSGGGGESGGSTSGGSSGGSSSGGGGLTSGSSNSITSQYDGDMWASVAEGVNQIIGNGAGTSGASGIVSTSSAPSGSATNETFVSLNRQAGLITVKANSKSHQKVREYLSLVRDYSSAQVLIEAKVVEVALDDQFKSGIDFAFLGDGNFFRGVSGRLGSLPSGTIGNDSLTDIGVININRGDLQATLQFAESFGTTRTLSSPRLLVMNNQQAVLSFATNNVYFTIEVEREDNQVVAGESIAGQTTVTSTVNTIPIGIILTLQPSINTKTNEIIMNIRPTLSRLAGDGKVDPASVTLASGLPSDASNETLQELRNIIPEVEVREMDSILRVKSGEIMAIGGMIEQRIQNVDQGIPYVSDVPVVGNLFKNVDKQTRSVQTVIFLKATIVPGYGVDPQDQNFYNGFTNDPRALVF